MSNRPIAITKRGKPLAKLVPVEEPAPRELQLDEGYRGDIVGPLEDAERGIFYTGEQ